MNQITKRTLEKALKNKCKNSYLSLMGNHVVVEKYLTGNAKKDRDRILKNSPNGIVTF